MGGGGTEGPAGVLRGRLPLGTEGRAAGHPGPTPDPVVPEQLPCSFRLEPADTLPAQNHLPAHRRPSVGQGVATVLHEASDSPRDVQPTPPPPNPGPSPPRVLLGRDCPFVPGLASAALFLSRNFHPLPSSRERWRLSFVKGWPLRLFTLGSVLLSALITVAWNPAMEEGTRGSLGWLHPDVGMGA